MSSRSRLRSPLVFSLFTIGLLVLISGIGAELVLRALGKGAPNDGAFRYVRHAGYNPFLIFGPHINRDIGQRSGPTVHYNAQGFRMADELPREKPAGEFRVFALGGSTTMNLDNNENLHYCGEANRILADATFQGQRFKCVNAAYPAYSTAQSMVRLQFDLLAFEPDVITVMHNVNDLHINFFPDIGRTNYARKYLDERYARTKYEQDIYLRYSRLAFIASLVWEKTQRLLQSQQRSSSEEGFLGNTMRFNPEPTKLMAEDGFRRNLTSIVQIAKAHGIVPVLLSQPRYMSEEKVARIFGSQAVNDRVLYPPLEEFRQLLIHYDSIIEAVAEEHGARFVHMAALFEGEEDHFIDAFHYSSEGLLRFADIYARCLERILAAGGSAVCDAGLGS